MPVTTWARSGAVMATLAALSGASMAPSPAAPAQPVPSSVQAPTKQRDGSHRMSVKVRVLLSSSHGGSGRETIDYKFRKQAGK